MNKMENEIEEYKVMNGEELFADLEKLYGKDTALEVYKYLISQRTNVDGE